MLLTVARLLPLAITDDAGWMRFPVLLPVAGMIGSPVPGTAAAILGITGIFGDLAAVVISLALPLAVRVTADRLAGLKLRGLEGLETITATPLDHAGVVA